MIKDVSHGVSIDTSIVLFGIRWNFSDRGIIPEEAEGNVRVFRIASFEMDVETGKRVQDGISTIRREGIRQCHRMSEKEIGRAHV
jgi:hypothetical protein